MKSQADKYCEICVHCAKRSDGSAEHCDLKFKEMYTSKKPDDWTQYFFCCNNFGVPHSCPYLLEKMVSHG